MTEAGHKMAARTGETATDKALPCKHENPSSDSQDVKEQGTRATAFNCNPELGGGDKEDTHGFLAGQLS